MANKKRLIDANAIQWEEHYVPDPNSDKQWDYKKELCVLKPTVDAMPTVDAVEVVHGRWIDDGGLDEDGNGQYRCSCCGVGEKHNPTVTVSYCWNCGAKMDGDGK